MLDGETNWSDPRPRLRKIEVIKGVGGWVVLVDYNASENLTGGLTKDSIELDMIDIYAAVYTSGEKISYASVNAFLPLIDQFGNESVDMAYVTRLDGKVGRRINWDNALGLDFGQLWEVLFAIREFQ